MDLHSGPGALGLSEPEAGAILAIWPDSALLGWHIRILLLPGAAGLASTPVIATAWHLHSNQTQPKYLPEGPACAVRAAC